MAHQITADCMMCGTCQDECPVRAIGEGEPQYTIDPDLCTDCRICADICPVEACVPEEKPFSA